MNTQEQFEALYADYTQTPIEQIVAARLGIDSYSLPAVSKAWVWYKLGRHDSEVETLIKERNNARHLMLLKS